MLKVVSFNICSFVQRVTALLEAKGISYVIEYISLKNKPQWFLDIAPNGQVPLLSTDTGTALFESDAIIEYMDEVHTPLEPELMPEQRAIGRAWSYQASKHYLTQCSAMRSSDEGILAERAGKLSKVFAKAEKQITDAPFFKGSVLSNVDIAWLPLLHRAAIIKQYTGYDFLVGQPKVQKWQTAIIEIGLTAKSVSEDFEEQFTGFYLSESSFLGQNRNCSIQ